MNRFPGVLMQDNDIRRTVPGKYFFLPVSQKANREDSVNSLNVRGFEI